MVINNSKFQFSDDEDVDYTGLSLLSGDIFEDLLGDEGDSDSKPVPAKKSNKKNKKPVVDELDNEVDAAINEVDDDSDLARPAQAASNDDDDDESEEGGILDLLDGECCIVVNLKLD